MMSATFLLLYYLDMILYENFFTSFLPSDPPTTFPKKNFINFLFATSFVT